MASAEQLLRLFDSYWFEYGIFTSKTIVLSTPPTDSSNPILEVHEEPEKADKQHLSCTPSLIVRSFSDHSLSSKDSFHSENSNDSPKSVLVPKLQTILSGKEVEEFPEVPPRREDVDAAVKGGKKGGMKRTKTARRRRREGNSKSLSELEFEELKGFMDLGFVFSEEAKDSRLVSIIPGLQRLGRQVCDDEDDNNAINEPATSRPYLSEAWASLDQKRKVKEDPLMNWRIPAFGNEMELKDHLRFWAHAVASTVR